MKKLKGFSFLALIFIIVGISLATVAGVYVVKKNPGAFFSATPQEISGNGNSEEGNSQGESSGGGKSMAERFLDMVGQKIKSIITPKPPIGNLTPVRDLRGTWKSSLAGKGMQTYSQFKTGPGTTQIYQEADVELIIESVSGNTASGTLRYINLCTWGRTTVPKIPTINVPKQCVSTPANPIQIRVSGTRLDFGSIFSNGMSFTMQGNYTTDLISGTMTATTPYGVVKGEFHLMRVQN